MSRRIAKGADSSLTPAVTGRSASVAGTLECMTDKWNALPDRPKPEEWVAEKDTNPLPGAIAEAEGDREVREARNVLERGF